MMHTLILRAKLQDGATGAARLVRQGRGCDLHLTQNMVRVQDELGSDFGRKIGFVSISLDPEHDTPAIRKDYAEFWGGKPEGWSFLTGSLDAVSDVTRRHGIFFAKQEDGSVEHSQLTTLVDGGGRRRAQYLGARFDREEFWRDLVSFANRE
jgi:protein SCO1/2